MFLRTLRHKLPHALLAGSLLLAASAAEARNIALLVGINAYRGAPLEGAVNDVTALREVLIRKWNFRSEDIRVLVDGDASHAAILRELRALGERSAPGDQVLVYFSGHGTSALDSELRPPLPDSTGAFVPADIDITVPLTAENINNRLIIGKVHLRGIFNDLDQKGRQLFVIMDSCYSGNGVRGLSFSPITFTPRYAVLPVDVGSFGSLQVGSLQKQGREEPYPYHNVVFLSAASDKEPADDIGSSRLGDVGTVDGKPHGAMTDALLRVLNGQINADLNGDGKLTYAEVHQAVLARVQQAHKHTPRLLPSLDDPAAAAISSALFAARGASASTGASTSSVPTVSSSPVAPVRVRLNADAGYLAASLTIPGINYVNNDAEFLLNRTGSTFSLRTAAGDEIISQRSTDPSHPRDSLPALTARLQAEVWLRQLLRYSGNGGGDLVLQTNRNVQGNNFVENDVLAFRFRASQPAYVLLLDLNGEGKLTQLYPITASERQRQPAATTITLPSEDPAHQIKIVPPFGLDQVIAIAFANKPAGWDDLPVLNDSRIDDDSAQALVKLLRTNPGSTYRTLQVRSFAAGH